MSNATRTRHAASGSAGPANASRGAQGWLIRAATHADVEAVAAAVSELLLELGGTPPAESAMRDTVRTLIDGPQEGAVLVADAAGTVIGVIAASWQTAIHAPGVYALIQDLWVDPAWRSRSVGAGLLAALFALARSKGMERVEVGLPREGFDRFAATEAFYLGNGFTPNGPRMRRLLA
jgi:GNAT superfamily N-acetyltransferase